VEFQLEAVGQQALPHALEFGYRRIRRGLSGDFETGEVSAEVAFTDAASNRGGSAGGAANSGAVAANNIRILSPHATTNFMPDVISEYQRWKQQGDSLRTQAKQAMESRFRELLTEAAAISEEYRSDFGAPLKPPAGITAFRYKASAKKARKAAKKSEPAKAAATAPAPKEPKPDPKIAGLQKRLSTAKKKLDDAKAAGAPTRKIEDSIYEIEDELRLAGQLVS
jgi:hypothetical protein